MTAPVDQWGTGSKAANARQVTWFGDMKREKSQHEIEVLVSTLKAAFSRGRSPILPIHMLIPLFQQTGILLHLFTLA